MGMGLIEEINVVVRWVSFSASDFLQRIMEQWFGQWKPNALGYSYIIISLET